MFAQLPFIAFLGFLRAAAFVGALRHAAGGRPVGDLFDDLIFLLGSRVICLLPEHVLACVGQAAVPLSLA